MMNLFIASIAVLIAIVWFSINNKKVIFQWIKQLLRQRFGLLEVKEFNISYCRRERSPALIIYIEGVHLRIQPSSNNSKNHPLATYVSLFLHRLPKPVIEFMLNIPIRLFMHIISNNLALHVDDFTIEKNNFLLHVDHTYIEFKSTKATGSLPVVYSIGTQIGPVQFYNKVAEKSLVVFEMTTLCLVTLSCHLGKGITRITSKDLELEIGLGKIDVNMNNLLLLQQSRDNNPSNSTRKITPQWKNHILNSIRVTVQHICFNFEHICVKVNNIRSSIQPQLLVTFDTELIECIVLKVPLFTMPSMEIKLSQSDHNDSNTTKSLHAAVPPYTTFVSITWILNSPIIHLPVNHAELMNTLMQNSKEPSAPLVIEEKVLPNLPMFTFALVVNTPKIEMSNINSGNGYVSTSSLIIRLSGEYMDQDTKNSNGSADNMISSSSSSNLDALFAQEEYQWLKNTRPKRTTATQRWLNLMGKVSHRGITQQKQPQHQGDSFELMGNKKWIYRTSAKIIAQKFNLGYITLQGKEKEFIRIKNTVIILKMKMMVSPNIDLKQYETIFSFDKSVHSEAALEKPVINLWNDDEEVDEPASIFWIKSLPQSIAKYKTNSDNVSQKEQPMWIKLLIRNICFSLDVIKGSIVAVSVDKRHDNLPVQPPPQGYFYNIPNEEVYSRLILDTQKFTFACDGPGNNEKLEWKSRCHMENLYIQQASYVLNKDEADNDEERKKQHVILWISQLNVNAKFLNTGIHKCVSISAKVKKYGIFYSIRNHYVCLLFARSLQMIKHRLSLNSDSRPVNKESDYSLLLELDAHVGRGDLQIHLPQNVKLYLRIDDLSIQKGATVSPIVKFRNLMILGVSPLHEGSWEQILEIDKAQISIKHRSNSSGIEIKSRKIFASIPYNYVLSAVIENIIGLVKAIKELHSRILLNKSFTYFGPTVNNDPIVIPCIHIKTRIFTIHFDDDPFEAKLRNIFRTGFVEQQKRLAYREALDNRIQEMLSSNPVSSATATAASDSISSSSVRQEAMMEDSSTYNGATPSPDMEVYSQIMEANKNLLERYSELWIKNINKTTTEEEDFYNDFHIRENYRNFATSDLLDESLDEPQRLESFTFMINIRPRPLHPPLANFSAHFVKVSFQPVDFSPSETKQFINTIGGGVPLNNDFSIIIPFHLTIKAGRTWIKVRDYPLPLMYVPPPSNGATTTDDNISARSSTRNNSHVSWTLEGDYVVGDELGNSGGSRIIPISIVPSSICSGYCLSAVRTASPLKFYSVIDYTVFTKSMSIICWSISYNPAIQDIIRVLESLTAASVDPSPRIGFWDKVRMIIHTRTKISFSGGGDLAIVVKGTRDPYQLHGRGAGLAKVWRNNVVWYLGYKNPQSEFMQFISRNYAFGVPNLNHDGYIPNFPDSLPIFKTAAENNSKFLKVALKLSDGIRMGIGLHYERLACNSRREGGAVCFKCASAHKIDRCRTQEFSPHYNIIYQSVKQVEANYDMNTYDAFEGFRSNFIHLSLSIVKLQNGEVAESPDFSKDDPYFMTSGTVSQNAMYLSPCFIKHFMSWYRLFGSPISLPVRQGKLFPKDEPKSLSFGEHLDTVKYKIVVNPLGIGFFCTDEETYLNVKGGGSAGLKARVNAFSVDLHSRKEVIRVLPPTTISRDEPSKTEMNFHEVELELHDIDLRVIRSTHVSGVQSDSKSTTTSFYDAASFDDDDDEVEQETKYSFQWVDPKDYFILDSVPQRNSTSRRKIDVHPFAFSPLFYYTKQNDEAGTERRQYLRGTHDCIMGKGPDSREFQKAHLHRRASDLDKVIENHDKQLDVILNAMNIVNHHDQETLNQQYEILVQKLDYLRTNRYMLHNYIAQLILETELNMTEPCSNNRDSPNTTTSSICRRNELSRWEMLMGHFRDRFFVHNPQIIWNNSVRDAIYYWQDIKNSRAVQDYNLSARCLKFLEDLVHTAEKQQQWKPDLPSSLSDPEIFINDIDMDKNVTQELIEKLLSERSHNFVAYNEKEEERARDQPQNYDGIYVESDSENVNDPDYQYKNIPENYEMKSKYLIDMINPQVNFQSEKGLDHLILFTNERIHVKAFGIIDNSNSGAADKDIRLVKDRIIVSLDNAQLLVAKRMEFLSFNLLTQSSYGQCRNLHWAAWVHPEQLWYYKDVRYFDNFQRVASQLSGTIQLDRYNHLRIKIDKYNTSRKSPFEDRTNTMQLHFPQFKLTLNSQQAHILYYTLINLLLGSDGSPRKKQRLSKFKDVMLAAERSDLAETVKQVGVLQNRSRALLDMHRRFIDQLPNLDSAGIREFNKNRKRMRENLEKLYLVVEAIRSIQTFRRDIHLEETDQAKRFTFTSDEIVWEAVMDDAEQSSLCKWTLISTKYVFLDKQNGSSRSTIEIDTMQIQNTTQSPVFINVLDRFIEPGQTEEPEYSRQKMLRGVLESLPPVGGIPIIQQLEVNLLPLHLQISTAFGSAMKDYFFPSMNGTEFQHTNVESSSGSNFEDVGEFEESDEDDENYYYEEDHDVSALNVGSRSSSKTDLFSLVALDKSNASTFSKREGSFASFDLLTQKVKQTVSRRRKVNLDELTVMKKRSSTNRTFIYVRIPATKHCLSLQGPTRKTFYNLYNFTFEQPNLEYRNKTWSMAEMMDDIQRQFLRAILRHSPALLKNKLLSNGSKQLSRPKFEISTTRRIAPAPSVRSVSSAKTGYISDNTSTHHHSSNSITDADTIKSNYNTEDEDDVKSLYSVDPEEELERLAESQTIQRRLSINVDKELQNVYMKKYKEEEEADEIVEKGKILFGDKYRRGSFHNAGL